MTEVYNTYQLAASVGYADRQLKQATKEQVTEAINVLAIAVGYHQLRFGEVPEGALAEMLQAGTLDSEQMAMVTAGMQNLAAALAEVLSDTDNTHRPAVH
ncbi:hypothetical protein [Thiorhodovibrio frisius]|uniref:Uncharacterized protein n=1 Tax=Thiorhodovibrio frisius TaxID=631362 RepID=H8YYX1_9GAMM|nr:hypothetical protein [Thiorhodovibrio frisius]EIC23647.1 hypothetical protein Thi970DRAFT_01328 [Thiorhodovibrio frisius]WPL23262.1 hypothetical protein Thiofri_03447 [Thiorhodovibrio frisius]